MAESPLAHTSSPGQPRDEVDDAAGGRLAPGDKTGDYEVERLIGQGAMGEVYAGRHPVIGKRVAIKVLRRELAGSPDAAIRFIREARAANQVDHPNVVDVFAFGTLADGRLYLVMDLIEGRSLRAAIREGSLDAAAALDVLAQVADAVDAAHARGVVHRDLKPDNVMLTGATPPKVCVLDFGLARLVASTSESLDGTTTAKGTWIGTPGYMAPEQWGAGGAGPAADRYALGVMAFELLSGQLPFQAPSLPAMMEQHFRAPVPALSTRSAIAVNARFDPVLERAMAKDPDARFATARALVAALRDAADGKPPARPPQRGRRRWLPAVAGAGVLGLSIAGVLAVRGRAAPARGEPAPVDRDRAPPADTIRLDVITLPAGATATRGDARLGLTPVPLRVRPGERIAIDLRKPGYAAVHREVDAPPRDGVVRVELAPVNGFEGVWALPDGQLRAFARAGEQVDAYKLDSASGERTFYRRFQLIDAPAGVAFAADEALPDARGAADPSCQIPHRVEYRYDPASDALEVWPERVETGRRDGRCFVRSRSPGSPLRLTRVDGDGDSRFTNAPVGKPRRTADDKAGPRPTAKDAGDQAHRKQEELRKAQLTRLPPAKQPPAKPTNDVKLDDRPDDTSSVKAPIKGKRAPPQASEPQK